MNTIQELKSELENQADYIFTTDKITYSSVGLKGDKQSYVTGYISVPEIDLYDDLVTPNALKSMLMQISSKNITLDYEHEAFRDDMTILPVGKIIEAKVDERGLWVKCQLNSNSPKYKALWGSIKDGFLNAFSIAFKPIRTVEKMMGKSKIRLIEELELLNVALTGTPVNQGATMTGHSMKAVMLKAIEDTKDEKVLVSKKLLTKFMEDKNMEETEKIESVEAEAEVVEEAKVEEPAEAPVEAEVKADDVVEAVEAEEATPEVVEESVEAVEEAKVEEKALEVIVADLKAKVEAQEAEKAELKSELEKLKETAVFKSTVSSEPIAEVKSVDMLQLIR